MSSDIVQPIALVFHELMANSLQHGALSRAKGRLEISWTNKQGVMLIGWSESSAARVPSSPEPGFGLKIIRAVVERQLGGSLDLAWTGEGLRAELSLPAALSVTV